MKAKTTLTLAFLVAIIIFSCNKTEAQSDTLTIRQMFDLDVGDTLIYIGYESVLFTTQQFEFDTVYHGRWGFTVIQKDTSADSIVYQYRVLGGTLVERLVIYYPDSTLYSNNMLAIGTFSINSKQMFNWLGLGVPLSYMQICNGFDTTHCEVINSVDTQFFNRIANTELFRPFEGYTAYSFMQKAGLFSVSAGGYDQTTAFVSGSDIMQLVYYHSGASIWEDTAAFNLTGINELNQLQAALKIYPNPTNGCFYLKADETTFATASKIKVYNMMGELAFEQKVKTGTSLQQINLPGSMAAGLYMLSIENPVSGPFAKSRLIKL